MKTFRNLMTLAFVLCAIDAFAAPPRPPADCGVDNDHDGWCVPDTRRVMPATPPATGTVPFHIGAVDCNDADRAVNPGATERLGDGIDNDCDTSTPDTADPKFRAFCGASPTAACIRRATAEIGACTGNCAVNYTSGKFVPAYGYHFVDKNCDGVRDAVLSQVDYDKWIADTRTSSGNATWTPTKDGYCPSKCGGAPCGTKRTGVRTGGKPAAPKVDPKLAERLGTLEKTVEPLPGKIDGLGKRVDEHDTLIADNRGRLDGLDKALQDETAARIAKDEEHDGILRRHNDLIADTMETAGNARRLAGAAYDLGLDTRSVGFSGGLQVGFMGLIQNPINLRGGAKARPGFAPTVYIGANIGVELDSSLFRLFGGVGLPFEEGPGGDTETGLVGTAGIEALWKLVPEHYLGVRARFLDHESGGDVLGAQARSVGGGGGLVYEFAPGSGRFRFPVQVSLEVLGEQLGSQSDSFRALGSGMAGMFFIGTGPGLGTPRDVIDSE